MTPRAPILGWFGAATTAAVLLSGAAALAITAMPPPPPVLLELGQSPPAIVAIAEKAPQVADEVAAQEPPATPDTPPPATPDTLALPLGLPAPKALPKSELALPSQQTPPKPAQAQGKVEKPKKRPDAKPAQSKSKDKPQKSKPEAAKAKTKRAPAEAAAPAASAKGQKAKDGAPKISSAAYAKAVMKQVRATRKKSGAGKGVAVIGFTVASNGGLAGVGVIRSSGNAALDQIAISHIERSAPFPVPPEGAGRAFSFEFIGK